MYDKFFYESLEYIYIYILDLFEICVLKKDIYIRTRPILLKWNSEKKEKHCYVKEKGTYCQGSKQIKYI